MTGEEQAALSESAGAELARLRRLAIVDELLTTLVGTLDVREVFARVSEVAGRVLPHDAISLPLVTEDREHVIPFATAGSETDAVPGAHAIPESERSLFTDTWEFEVVDDMLAEACTKRPCSSTNRKLPGVLGNSWADPLLSHVMES